MTLSGNVTDAIANGKYTLQFRLSGLASDPRANTSLVMESFASGNLGRATTFSTTESWPVLESALSDPGDINTARDRFPNAFVTSGKFVSGFAQLTIGLPLGNQILKVPLRHAIVIATIDAAGSQMTSGTIAGVVPMDDLVTGFKTLAGGVGICGSLFDGIEGLLRQCADILADGDGMSVGIGFDAKRIANPTLIQADPPVVDSCDAGPDAAKDAASEGD